MEIIREEVFYVMKYLVAGLGNVGEEYENTRHNVGFQILDKLAKSRNASFSHERLAYYTLCKYNGRSIHLIKPTTYMNLSGKAIQYWLNQLKLRKKKLLIVTDDISLPLGKIRLKPKGSSGGHNGLKDIENTLKTQEFPRLRFGIGDDFRRGNQIGYVLERFNPSEIEPLSHSIEKSIKSILSFATTGIERTMNNYN